jgi:serine/threonine protein kinase
LLLVGRPGRVVEHAGAEAAVPRDFLIPTCDQCGFERINDACAAELNAALNGVQVSALRMARTEKMGVIAGSNAAFAVGGLVSGTYEIRRVVGAGGMGTVYEAHDRLLNRRVALKVAQSTGPEFSLRKEAQALAAIRHPSMVTVFAIGNHGGVEYLVMEMILGTTLHDHFHKSIRSGKQLTIREVLDILIGIAEGLAAVHASGISHRDIKPANIMLAPGNRTVLMDFGLFTPEFERLDTVAGSPEYMAPEIYSASVDPGAGHLVDLYALGVIAFELFTGRPPFRGANAIATLGLHTLAPVPNVAHERSGLPAELAALVTELLAKAPADRPQGIEDVLGRLRSLRVRDERRPTHERFTVLIVDDDRDFAETMRAVVRVAVPDADVTVANDGEAALASLIKRVPTVMLLDLNMPRMNGLELCMTLRGSGLATTCEIVSVNGSATPKDRELLKQLGVRENINKTPALSHTIVELMKTSKRRWQSVGTR